jgi:hypothetical protein
VNNKGIALGLLPLVMVLDEDPEIGVARFPRGLEEMTLDTPENAIRVGVHGILVLYPEQELRIRTSVEKQENQVTTKRMGQESPLLRKRPKRVFLSPRRLFLDC